MNSTGSMFMKEKMMMDTKEFRDIIKISNPKTAYMHVVDLVNRYTEKDEASYRESYVDIIFIAYLKRKKKENKDSHIYEDALLKLYPDISPVIASHILSSELELHYTGYDRFGIPACVADSLAIYTTDEQLIKLVASRLEGLNQIYFTNPDYNMSTDMVRIHILNHELDKAYKVFMCDGYVLSPNNIDLSQLKNSPNGIYVPGLFNSVNSLREKNGDDTLYMILKTLESIDMPTKEKVAFMCQILQSGKVKYLNIESFSIIKRILGKSSYSLFAHYLVGEYCQENITFYKVSRKNEGYGINIMQYIPQETLVHKKDKEFKIEPKKDTNVSA